MDIAKALAISAHGLALQIKRPGVLVKRSPAAEPCRFAKISIHDRTDSIPAGAGPADEPVRASTVRALATARRALSGTIALLK